MQNSEWKVILDQCQQLVPLTSRITLFWQLCKDDYIVFKCKVTYDFKAFNSINCIHNGTFLCCIFLFFSFLFYPSFHYCTSWYKQWSRNQEGVLIYSTSHQLLYKHFVFNPIIPNRTPSKLHSPVSQSRTYNPSHEDLKRSSFDK